MTDSLIGAACLKSRVKELKSPRRAYHAQRFGAASRGIAWELTFDSWWAIWQPYYHMRGKGTNELCMARRNDVGPYSVENVYLTTNLGNNIDASRTDRAVEKRKASKESRERAFARAPSSAISFAQAKSSMAIHVVT